MAVATIKLIDAEGWKMEKDFDDIEEFLVTLVNANRKNKRATEKVVSDYDADNNVITIKVVAKE